MFNIAKNIANKWVFLLAAVLCTCGLMMQDVAAQSQQKSNAINGITISPFLQEQTLQANDLSKAFFVTLTNNTKEKKDFSLFVLDFGSLDETGGLTFSGGDTSRLAAKYGLADWIKLERSEVSLEPGAKADIKAVLINNGNLSPGGHYAAILATIRTSTDDGKNTINLKQMISSLIFARKIGGERYDLKLDSLVMNNTRWRAPSQVTLRFHNPGNVYNVPRGVVSLKSGSKQISEGVINEESGFVLPESYRKLTTNLRTVNNTHWWLIRNYTLEVKYRYEGLDRFASKTLEFRVINDVFVFGGLALAFVLAVAAVLLYRFGLLRQFWGWFKRTVLHRSQDKSDTKSKKSAPEPKPKIGMDTAEKTVETLPETPKVVKKIPIKELSPQKTQTDNKTQSNSVKKPTNSSKKINVKSTDS